jgi:hypothetical protein
MSVRAYLRKGIVYIPTSMKIPGGPSVETEPVQVVPVSDTEALAQAFDHAIRAGNPPITDEQVSGLPNWMPARTGLKSWSTFARGTLTWSLRTDRKTGAYRLHAGVLMKGGGWTDDPLPAFDLPADTPIPEVARRAAAAVQDAVKLSAVAAVCPASKMKISSRQPHW